MRRSASSIRARVQPSTSSRRHGEFLPRIERQSAQISRLGRRDLALADSRRGPAAGACPHSPDRGEAIRDRPPRPPPHRPIAEARVRIAPRSPATPVPRTRPAGNSGRRAGIARHRAPGRPALSPNASRFWPEQTAGAERPRAVPSGSPGKMAVPPRARGNRPATPAATAAGRTAAAANPAPCQVSHSARSSGFWRRTASRNCGDRVASVSGFHLICLCHWRAVLRGRAIAGTSRSGAIAGDHPVAIGIIADEPELPERSVEQPILVVVGHRHQARPGNFEPAGEQPMGDKIARLRPQMHREAISAEAFGQMVHHSIVVERELQAQRLAQQHDPADLSPGKPAVRASGPGHDRRRRAPGRCRRGRRGGSAGRTAIADKAPVVGSRARRADNAPPDGIRSSALPFSGCAGCNRPPWFASIAKRTALPRRGSDGGA